MKEVATIVIGAGAAGLSLTSLLHHSQAEVLCLEAHHTPGGSAGYFKRGKFIFDAGATTLSGFEHEGPLKRFMEITSLHFDLRKIDPGITISFNDQKIHRFGDLSRWIAQQKRLFPQLNLEPIWQKIQAENKLAWELARSSADFPPRSLSSLRRLLTHHLGQKLRVLPLLFDSLASHLEKISPLNSEYQRLLDELLLISTQNTSKNAPALVGVMGLSYPQDTWYPMGGMEAFFTTLLSPIKEQVRFKEKVISIRPQKNHFLVQTNLETYRCQRLVSSLPIWNTHQLLGKFSPFSPKKMKTLSSESWGALTGYYTIKLRNQPLSLYHQVHTNRISCAGSHSLFLSLCPLDDLGRCDGIYQTLSVSTHISLSAFKNAIQVDRSTLRKKWNEEFQAIIREYFGEDVEDLKSFGMGDPITFEHYTGRYQGLVGGLSHSLKRNIFTWPHSHSGIKNLYQVGDTTFPGQGIVGVMQGSLNLWQELQR